MKAMPFSYSPATVERCFKRIRSVEAAGVLCELIYDADTPRIALMEANMSGVDGEMRHKIIALADIMRIGDRNDTYSVTSIWADQTKHESVRETFHSTLKDAKDFKLVGL